MVLVYGESTSGGDVVALSPAPTAMRDLIAAAAASFIRGWDGHEHEHPRAHGQEQVQGYEYEHGPMVDSGWMNVEDYFVVADGGRLIQKDSDWLAYLRKHSSSGGGGGSYVRVRVLPRARAGKGGFGSQLRSTRARAGQRVEDHRAAARDLHGRRIGDVERERELREWHGREDERRLERAGEQFVRQRALERRGRKRPADDAEGEEEGGRAPREIEAAVREGLRAAAAVVEADIASSAADPPATLASKKETAVASPSPSPSPSSSPSPSPSSSTLAPATARKRTRGLPPASSVLT